MCRKLGFVFAFFPSPPSNFLVPPSNPTKIIWVSCLLVFKYSCCPLSSAARHFPKGKTSRPGLAQSSYRTATASPEQMKYLKKKIYIYVLIAVLLGWVGLGLLFYFYFIFLFVLFFPHLFWKDLPMLKASFLYVSSTAF